MAAQHHRTAEPGPRTNTHTNASLVLSIFTTESYGEALWKHKNNLRYFMQYYAQRSLLIANSVAGLSIDDSEGSCTGDRADSTLIGCWKMTLQKVAVIEYLDKTIHWMKFFRAAMLGSPRKAGEIVITNPAVPSSSEVHQNFLLRSNSIDHSVCLFSSFFSFLFFCIHKSHRQTYKFN